MPLLLSCDNLSKTFGAPSLFEGVSLAIGDGDRIGLIGPNGSGKSTLLKIIAGRETADVVATDRPQITARRNMRVGYVAQQDRFDAGTTLLDVVAEQLADRWPDPHEREVQAAVALDKADFGDPHATVGSLSGGWRKRLAIIAALAAQPDLLLLDEPTNHLDVSGIEWLEQLLEAGGFAAVVVTHDRYFLERAVTRVVELSRAYPQGTFAVDGPYSTFLRRRADFLEGQQQQQQSLATKVRDDLKWLARGAKARRTKSKSRIDAAGERSAELSDLKSRNAPTRAADIAFSASGRRTRKLLTGRGLTKSLGGRTLFRDLDIELAPGECVGLLGPNGSGKTTLIRVLSGELTPDAGVIERADNLRTVVFTQGREDLDPRQPMREALWPHGDFVTFGDQQVHIHTWASRFLFRPEQLNVSVGDLSGGEQARILMARLMLRPADLLILDEPTNDLDIASLEVLEQSLSQFPGAVLLVTHDRFMLDRLSTTILALDGRGGVASYAELSQWRDAQQRQQPAEQDPPPAARKPPAGGPAKAASAAAPARLSYKEQRELEQMESAITAAEAEVARLEALLAGPAAAADHVRQHEHYRQLAAAQQEVSRLYDRWQALEARGG